MHVSGGMGLEKSAATQLLIRLRLQSMMPVDLC